MRTTPNRESRLIIFTLRDDFHGFSIMLLLSVISVLDQLHFKNKYYGVKQGPRAYAHSDGRGSLREGKENSTEESPGS